MLYALFQTRLHEHQSLLSPKSPCSGSSYDSFLARSASYRPNSLRRTYSSLGQIHADSRHPALVPVLYTFLQLRIRLITDKGPRLLDLASAVISKRIALTSVCRIAGLDQRLCIFEVAVDCLNRSADAVFL
jgi:hypothetical protein